MPWYSGNGGVMKVAETIGGAVADVQRVRRAWHWDSPRPRSWPAKGVVVPPPASDLGWARQEPVRTIRYLIQHGLLLPFTEVMSHPKVEGREWVRELERPVIFAANHSSHLDAPLVLCSLPPAWRHQTLVAAAADYFFDDWWRAFGTALVFGTVPLDRTGGTTAAAPSATPHALLTEGWSLLFFPEGTRAPDGQMAGFKTGAARLSVGSGAPIVPIGIRGSFAAMPRGRSWPVAGRPRVAVRFGPPMHAHEGESAKRFTNRIAAEISRLNAEDETTWWQSLCAPSPASRIAAEPVAEWRRVWASTAPIAPQDRSTPWD